MEGLVLCETRVQVVMGRASLIGNRGLGRLPAIAFGGPHKGHLGPIVDGRWPGRPIPRRFGLEP